MKCIEQNKREFAEGYDYLCRRLSNRECAGIQTFPYNFKFRYSNLTDAYKMIGNAVPVRLVSYMAEVIYACKTKMRALSLSKWSVITMLSILVGGRGFNNPFQLFL